MNNFLRVLRLALRHRLTVAASVACAVMVGLLWSANIASLYPVVSALFKEQSLQHWLAKDIAQGELEIGRLNDEIQDLSTALERAAEDEQASIAAQIETLEVRLEAEQKALSTRVWAQPYVERYVPHDPFRTLALIVALLVAGTVLKDLFIVLGSFLVDRLTYLAILDLRKTFFRRTLRLDLSSFNENSTSELISRFTYDVDSIATGMQALLGKAVREPLKMLACLVMAGWICWRLLFLSLVVAPLAGYIITRLAKSLKRANRRAMEDMSQLYGVLAETFGGIKVVKAFTMERYERRRFHHSSKSFFRRAMKIARYNALVHPATELLGISTVCVAFLAGAYLVLNQETHLLGIKMCNRPLDQGSLIVFYGLLIGACDPARKLSEIFNRLQRAAAACDRVYQLLDREPASHDRPRLTAVPRHHCELVFDNVSFGYKPDQRVLENISLRIPFGETLAIVGPNGCGKSTLANLIPRFFDPVEGCVRLDGIDLREANPRDLRRQIGVVTQETLLFDDTVLNNIRYGSPGATYEQVVAAAKKAHAHKFITERLDNGYETEVGPMGGRLSGGQRQRIAIARAILRDPAILILDEATSQVDLESEQLIQMVLEQFTRDRTSIIITHRLATLDLADRILVMQSGRVLDVGTHAELTERCDFYRRLYQMQFKEAA